MLSGCKIQSNHVGDNYASVFCFNFKTKLNSFKNFACSNTCLGKREVKMKSEVAQPSRRADRGMSDLKISQ